MSKKRVLELEKENAELKQQLAELKTGKALFDSGTSTFSDTQILRELIRVSPLAVVVLDLDGKIIVWSPACEQLFGWTAQEVIGHPNPLVPPEKSAEYQVLNDLVLQGKNLVNLDVIRRHKDGHLVDVSISTAALTDENGRLIGRMAMLADITSQKEVEKILWEQSDQYQIIASASLDGLVAIGLDGRLLDINDGYCNMVGFRRDELLGRFIWDVDVIESQELAMSHINQIWRNGSDRYETRHRCKDNHFIDLEVSSIYAPRSGRIFSFFHDITERKKTETGLRQSEEHFRLLFESHHAIMLLIDPETGNIVDANPAAASFYGYGRATLCSMNISQINCLPANQVAADRQRAISQRRNFFIFPHRKANGEVRIVEVHSSPILIRNQSVLFSIIHDITERMRAEERERALAQKYRIVAENTYDWEYWLDPKGNFAYCSPACKRITGYSVESFLKDSRLLESIIHQDDLEIFKVHRRNSSGRGHAEEIEFRIKRIDGDVRWIGHYCQPVYDEAGVFLGIRGSNRDITERKRMNVALLESESRYRAVVENQSEFIVRWKLDGTRTFVNEAYCRYFNIQPQEALFINFLDLVDENDRPGVRDKIHRLVSGVTHQETDIHRVIRPDGSIAWQEWVEQAIYDDAGIVVEIQSVGRDVTSRIQAEIALRTSLAEKEALLRELYHRTKNNMQVIIAMLDMQASYIDNPRLVSSFVEMQNRIYSMALVHQKLYQSQNLSSINLKEYALELANLIITNYQPLTNDVHLSCDLHDAFVLIDIAVPCGLLINELIFNAIKHAFPIGATGEIKLQLHIKPNNTLILKVSDNGIGVPPGFDFRRDGKMGIQIIFALVEHQLRGKVKFTAKNGVTCQLEIPESSYSPRV